MMYATTVDAARASDLARMMGRLTETQPGPGGLEQTIEHLKAQRQAIDATIDEAMTALVRERAERLRAESERKAADARALLEAARSDPLLQPRPWPATGLAPRPETPDATRSPTAPAAPAAPAVDEIRLLREELRKLREEVESLRKKAADTGPK